MTAFISWYITITLLGWLTFPLVFKLFPGLADRGYPLARVVALLVWGYAFWLLASLHLAQNNLGGLLLGILVLLGLSAWALYREGEQLLAWIKSRLGLIAVVEVLFLVAFAFLAVVRAANPEATGTEKPMELAFINAILRSPSFPPNDPWLSGYAISYYYFGYVMTAMLAKLTSVSGSVAFNLMLALVFGLSASGAYGLIYNLLAARKKDERPAVFRSLLGPLFLLLVSNLEGFLEVLHQRGLFWTFQPDGSASSTFWSWLDMKDLSQPPNLPLSWIPDRFWWWWRASRVVHDYDLQHNFNEVIDEFPWFSYLLGDLHPHVLAMPFGLLAVAVALNLFLGGWKGKIDLFVTRLYIRPEGFLFSALVLGGLAFLNTWDILVAAAMIVGAYVLLRVREGGWHWERLEDLLGFGLPVGALAFLLYLPFYIGFSSQAGGLLPNVIFPTRGVYLWIMFGSLFVPLLAWLIFMTVRKPRVNWRIGFGLSIGIVLALGIFGWLSANLAVRFSPDLASSFLQSQGGLSVGELFNAGLRLRLARIGGLLTLVFLLGPALSFLIPIWRADLPGEASENDSPALFVMLLIALGALLVLAPEFVYLRDQFSTRMNTIFKFYYQAWMLWSLAAAFGVAVLLQSLRGVWNVIYRVVLALVLFMALTYPVLSVFNKTNNFHPFFGWTLDGAAHLQREIPDDAAGIQFLQQAPFGILAEAVGGSYTGYARMSEYSGLPTVLGWVGHEGQWRGSYAPQGSRQADIQTLYETNDWSVAVSILQQYHIRYIVVGSLERNTYHVHEQKFQKNLPLAFQQGTIIIYEVP